jgi:tRNA pseudouridine65 synthase
VNLPIIYQDDYLLVINKPNNILVHPSFYARNIESRSMIEILKDEFGVALYPIHRLDHKTSGIIVFAKSAEIAKQMQALFVHQTIQKTYHAIVRGHIPTNGIVNSPVKNADTGIYKDAHTAYSCLSQTEIDIPVQPYAKSRYSFIALSPKTGRMHQLRKHMNKISHPIIGDNKYGNRHHNHMFQEKFGQGNLFLHASKIEFEHPVTKSKLLLSAPLPPFWQKLATQLNWDFLAAAM